MLTLTFRELQGGFEMRGWHWISYDILYRHLCPRANQQPDFSLSNYHDFYMSCVFSSPHIWFPCLVSSLSSSPCPHRKYASGIVFISRLGSFVCVGCFSFQALSNFSDSRTFYMIYPPRPLPFQEEFLCSRMLTCL